MDSDRNVPVKEINGINLDNYFVQQRSYNSAVFVHKKYLEESESVKEKVQVKPSKGKKSNKKEKKQDKCQQFTSDNNITKSTKTYKLPCCNNTVLDHTIKFAKNIVPLMIPPDEDKPNVYYTIKTSKKHKRTDKKPRNSSFEHHELAQEQEDPKRFVETYRKKVKKESSSIRESISHSSNNTLEDLNINQSLCCTFSEVSEKKYHKKEKHCLKRSHSEQKFAISESFEAVATENVGGDAKIKIHLMNEKDKHFLSDTIKEPILNAIRNCILELNNNNSNTEFSIVQKYVKCNCQKLDNILDKLTSIEKKLDIQEKKLETYEMHFGNQQNKLNIHEQKLHAFQNRLDSHELKLNSHEAKLSAHEVKLDSHEKPDSREKKLDSQIIKRGSHEGKLDSCEAKLKYENEKLNNKLDSHSKENKVSARETNLEVEDKRVILTKVKGSNAKSSTLEELGADLIEMDEEYTSEEELHQELLDRRSKSTVVEELAPKSTKENRMETLGGGEVPPTVKGTSIGTKLERPNRIPARFCWTDTVRKN